MKRIFVFLFILLLSGVVFAGGTKETTQGPAPKPSGKQIVLRLADNAAQDHPNTLGDNEFARLVKERTSGRITIDVYHSAQLGQEKAVIEQVQFGAIDFTRVSISPLTAFAQQFDALQMPYLYRDAAHMWKVLNGPIGDDFLKSLEPAKLIGMSFFDSGSRNFYNSKREVKSPADLRGMKIRVQQSELMIRLVEAFGATATPMAYGEVYSGLQTKVIDGAENNLPGYHSTAHFEVAKYIIMDEHTRVPEITIGSKISLDKLTAEDQALIKKAARDSTAHQIEIFNKYQKIAEDKVRAAGNIITPVPDKREWQALMKPLYEKQPALIQEWIKKIQAVQ